MVEMLLDVADEGNGDKIKEFEGEQATGMLLNELTELYYKDHPRKFEDEWPQQKYLETDNQLRVILTNFTKATPAEVRAVAKEKLPIHLDG